MFLFSVPELTPPPDKNKRSSRSDGLGSGGDAQGGGSGDPAATEERRSPQRRRPSAGGLVLLDVSPCPLTWSSLSSVQSSPPWDNQQSKSSSKPEPVLRSAREEHEHRAIRRCDSTVTNTAPTGGGSAGCVRARDCRSFLPTIRIERRGRDKKKNQVRPVPVDMLQEETRET